MKKIHLYIIILILIAPVIKSNAQEAVSQIRTSQVDVNKVGDRVMINFDLILAYLNMPAQQMITITPIARSADRMQSYEFAPIIVSGVTRDKVLNRAVDFGNYEFPKAPQLVIRHYNNNPKNYPVSLEMPYAEWVHEADLVFATNTTGCACDPEGSGEYDIATLLPPLFIPSYQPSYVTPPVEEVKRRSETYSAHINFEVGRHVILHNFKDNARILEEVHKVINELRNDPNLTVNEFTVTGYASPEGNPQSNMTLSENRAKAFVNYLKEHYGISSYTIKTDWKGEDWDGLKEAVEKSSIADRQRVLDILNNGTDVMVYKRSIEQLSGGETYRMLLRDYYPPLRRNEYTISYIAKPFSIDEAKTLIRTKPHQLSENEIFLVANTYPKNSNEFKEVFDIAARLYPNNPYTRLNIMTLEIENGKRDAAMIQRLQQLDIPEAWNNLGLVYTYQGDYQKAQELFRRAANAGVKEAVVNSDQLARFLATQ